VKINLTLEVLPAICDLTGKIYLFQRDSVLAQQTKLLHRETFQLLLLDMWPPVNPDLNPVNYCNWGFLRECVYYHTLVTELL